MPPSKKPERGTACSSFQSSLRVRQDRLATRREPLSQSCTPYTNSSLSPMEMKKRMAKLQQELFKIRKQNMHLNAKLAQEAGPIGVTVDTELLQRIME